MAESEKAILPYKKESRRRGKKEGKNPKYKAKNNHFLAQSGVFCNGRIGMPLWHRRCGKLPRFADNIQVSPQNMQGAGARAQEKGTEGKSPKFKAKLRSRF